MLRGMNAINAVKKLARFYLIFGLGFFTGVAFAAFSFGLFAVGQTPSF
jgi:hypothetical protein